MIFQKAGAPVVEGSKPPPLKTIDAIEQELGNNATLYGHSITRPAGGKDSRVIIVPAATPVVWVPAQSESDVADGRFGCDLLGQHLPCREQAH